MYQSFNIFFKFQFIFAWIVRIERDDCECLRTNGVAVGGPSEATWTYFIMSSSTLWSSSRVEMIKKVSCYWIPGLYRAKKHNLEQNNIMLFRYDYNLTRGDIPISESSTSNVLNTLKDKFRKLIFFKNWITFWLLPLIQKLKNGSRLIPIDLLSITSQIYVLTCAEIILTGHVDTP